MDKLFILFTERDRVGKVIFVNFSNHVYSVFHAKKIMIEASGKSADGPIQSTVSIPKIDKDI